MSNDQYEISRQLGELVGVVGGLRDAFVDHKQETRANFDEMKVDLGEIKEQTTAHNGRMSKLEVVNERREAAEKALRDRDAADRADRNFLVENWKWTIGTLITFIGLLIAGLAFVMGGHL